MVSGRASGRPSGWVPAAGASVLAALVVLSVVAGGMVLLSAPASAQVGSCDATVAAGDSIQSAINSAAQGDTICVEAGTYAEEVTLNVTGVSLVAADHDNPPVLDGTGLDVGVTIVNDSVAVDGFEIRNYGQWGIDAHPFTTSQDVSIRNNTIANNSNGLRAGGLTNGLVVNNTVVDNKGDSFRDYFGIEVRESHGIEIRGNNVSNNGDIGIGEASTGGSDNSVIANNTLLDNGVKAIDYRGSSTNIEGNLVGGSNTGIDAGTDSIVRDNNVEADHEGISGTSSTEIVNNTVTGATTGIGLSSASNAIVHDNVVTGAQVGIRVEDTTDIGSASANVSNNTASGNSVDLWLVGSEGVLVANNTFETGAGIHADPIARANFVHTFENNTVQGDPLFYTTGVDDPTVPDTVGQVIVANATNVTVEGHAFDGVAAPIQVYFAADADIRANTIANDTLEEMALTRRGSIAVLESTGTSVRDNQITGGTVGAISLQVDGGREVAVLNNTVSDSPSYGIHIGPFGDDHEVRNNTVSGAGEDGIHVTGAISGQGDLTGVVVADNQVSASARYGIHVRSQADGTRLTGNTVTQNAVLGVRVIDSSNVWIEANDVSQNDGAGLVVDGESANAMIVDNVANANLGPGIHVRPDPDDAYKAPPDNVTVQDNEAADNDEDDQSYTASFYGIRIEGIQTAKIDNNFVSGNDRGGIVIESATDVRVAHNTVSDNGDVHRTYPNSRLGTGIHVIGSSAVTVNGNTVTNNPVHGIEVNTGSSDVNVTYNNVEQNVRRGVFVENANDVLLGHNIVRSNDIGIYVASITAGSSADSVIISNNLVELNTGEGVIVTGTEELYAEANDFLDNDVGVRVDGASTNATLRDNEIDGNTMGVNGSAADDVVDARENWWGASNGPSGGVADPVNGTLADGDGDPVTTNVRFDPWSSQESSTGGTPGVIASSFVHHDGTEPELENITVDAFVASGLLQIQLVNTTADPADLESRYELGGVGADETTAFEIEVKINSSAPRVLVGAGNVSDWNVTENGDGTTNVTVVVSPISSQQIIDCNKYNGCTPPTNNWPEGENDTATVANDAIVSLAADPLTGVDTQAANRLNGSVLTTDAQAFGSPVYDPVAEQLSVFVAAPSSTVADTQNEGIYRAFLPNALLDEWGVENGSELKAAFDGQETDFTSQEGTDGITIAIDMHYSAGEVTLSTLDPASFEVTSTTVNDPITEGETLTVDATVENTGGATGTQTVTLSIGGTQRDSTSVTLNSGDSQTVTLSWSTSDGDAGDYTATVSSANDSATASVTVESSSTSSSSGDSSTSGGPAGSDSASSTSSPTATPTSTTTVTATPASTATPVPTASPTAVATPTATPSPSGTATPDSSGEPTASPPAVTDSPEPSPEEAVTETPGQPGFGFLVALLAVGLLGFGLTRRRD